MIHWCWLIPAAMLGAGIGVLVMCLLYIAGVK